MIDCTLRPEALRVDDTPQSIYVYFRDEIPIKEALRFFVPQLGRVLVYVGSDGLPVALQSVDPIKRDPPPGGEAVLPYEVAQTYLFGLASKMIAYVEANRTRLGEMLIQDALRTLKAMPPEHLDSTR